MKEDAIELGEVFLENEVDRIYLNFSDPWPKKRHSKRRLTSHTFLPVFKTILQDNGELILKTDNRTLFEFSLISFQQFHMSFIDVCLDLHNSEGYEDNIETEYERKFSPYGPIYRIVTKFEGD
jgi:tRNA (guanine-N7-)-methyltransferase